MRKLSHLSSLLAAGTVAAAGGAPAFAATLPVPPQHFLSPHATSLHARAAKRVVAPGHDDTLMVTLEEGRKGVAGESQDFVVRSRRDARTARWSSWAPVAAMPRQQNGRYEITVMLPAGMKKGQNEQYEVRFRGDEARRLAPSHSQVITVKAG
jgi:hypothetical protein